MPTAKEIQQVWEKGKTIKGKDPRTHRKDAYGNEIYRYSYGRNTPKGWEIDHKKPRSKGGSDTLRNKQPLQTAENRRKSNTYPYRKKRK